MGDDVELTAAVRGLVLAAERYRLGVARATLGVGALEMMALAQVFVDGPRTPGELRDRLQITSASVTELVDRLERGALVRRGPHPTDRRKVLVELTPATRERLAAAFARFSAATGDSAAGLGPGERQVVLRFLRSAADTYSSIAPG